MGFQMQIYSILRVSWSILAKCVFIRERAPAKLKCFLWRRIYSHNFDCFLINLSRWYIFTSLWKFLSLIRRRSPSRNVPSGDGERRKLNGCSRRLLYLFLRLSLVWLPWSLATFKQKCRFMAQVCPKTLINVKQNVRTKTQKTNT